MPAKNESPNEPAHQRLHTRAAAALKLLQPRRGQFPPLPDDDDDTPVFINSPTDPHGYGPGIQIAGPK